MSTTQYPYNAICYVTTLIGGSVWQGSGVYISPDEILTAAHVVYRSDLGVATTVTVRPGYNLGTAPYGTISGEYIHYYNINDANGLISNGQTQTDFALIHVQSVSTTGWMGITPNDAGGAVHITGYPGTSDGAQVDSLQTLSLLPGYSEFTGQSLGEGSSGGPVWAYVNGSPQVYVVVSSGTTNGTGYFGQITSTTFNTIEQWIDADQHTAEATCAYYANSDDYGPLTVSDFGGNIAKYFDTLNAAAQAGYVGAVTVSDRFVSISYGQWVADSAIEAHLTGNSLYVVEAATAAQAQSILGHANVRYLYVTDSGANVVANLDTLQALAQTGQLNGIAVSDAGTSLTVTPHQFTSDAGALSWLQGSASILVSGAVGAAGLSTTETSKLLMPITVADSSANVLANLDTLNTIAASGKLQAIDLTDSAIPTLTVGSYTLVTEGYALKAIASPFDLDVLAPSTASATVAGLAGKANIVSFIGASSQYTVTSSGDGTSLTVAGNGFTYTLSNVQALQFADHTDIVASSSSSVPGAVTTAQITELYSAILGRTPDVAGLSFYQSYAAANPSTPFQQFASWFLQSPEYADNSAHNYAQTVAGDQQFVTDSYNNLLHRAPSAAEVAYYETNVIAPALQGLTPGTSGYASADAAAHALTLTYFSQSPEFLTDVSVTAQNPTSAQHWLVLV